MTGFQNVMLICEYDQIYNRLFQVCVEKCCVLQVCHVFEHSMHSFDIIHPKIDISIDRVDNLFGVILVQMQ